jgi:chloramphenicol-sensitive protein RarD
VVATPDAGQRIDPYPEYRRGVAFGATAYGLWGLFPLFWTLLSASGALETLAHRMVWALVVVLAILLWTRRVPELRAVLRNRRQMLLLAGAAVLISANWGGYIWGVNHGRVVETALGYFTGPLVSVLIGVLFLGERLRRAQWTAVGLGTVAIVVLVVGYGQVPWVALVLAFSFSTYGLLKKLAGVGAIESIAVETGVTLLPALAYVVFLEATGQGTFVSLGIGHTLLLISGGLVTMVPRGADSALDDRAAAVPGADPAVHVRCAGLPRADAPGTLAWLRHRVAGPDHPHHRRHPPPLSSPNAAKASFGASRVTARGGCGPLLPSAGRPRRPSGAR